MQSHKKTIRDFENYAPPTEPVVKVRIWGTTGSPRDGAKDYLLVDLYCVSPDQVDPSHVHPNGIEILLCLQGTATLTLWTPRAGGTWYQLEDVEINEGETVLIPPGVLHRVINSGAEGLLLLSLHPSDTTTQAIAAPASVNAPGPFPPELKLRIRDFEHYTASPDDMFIRERVWGRDAIHADGSPDAAKNFLHMNLYCIIPKQSNPLHFHPNSIELIICLQGQANVTVRPRLDDKSWEPHHAFDIQEGDTVLVPKAGLHRYYNNGETGLLLIALQTPHAILHLFPDEAFAG